MKLPLKTKRILLAAALLAAGSCSDSGTAPGSLRFGQIGEVRLHLAQPLDLGKGELQQSLTWNSSGPWRFTEVISYGGVEGDTDMRVSQVNPEQLARQYAQWISEVNDHPAVRLFIPELDRSLDEPCRAGQSRITLRIRDDSRNEEMTWIRCVQGSFGTLSTRDAGPDAQAARVAAAALFLRGPTVGEGFQSTYHASFPFATLDRGEDTPTALRESRAILDVQSWNQFWASHAGSASTPPPVDFSRESVIVAAVGVRREAGDSVEVRRILPVGDSTVVTLAERIPGDFCSPAERLHVPFHVVVTPRVPAPVRFASPIPVERVPCGV